jgi:hypothetical protein
MMKVGIMVRRYLPVALALFVVVLVPCASGAAQSEKSKAPKSVSGRDDPGTWMLAGREGACAPLSLLEKKGSEFRGIEAPEQLAKKMRDAGHKVEVKEHHLASRPAVEVRVPDRGLYVMFVKANQCTKIETPAAK